MERLVRLRKFQRIPFRRNDDKRSAGLKEFSFVNAGLDFRVSGVAISDSFTGIGFENFRNSKESVPLPSTAKGSSAETLEKANLHPIEPTDSKYQWIMTTMMMKKMFLQQQEEEYDDTRNDDLTIILRSLSLPFVREPRFSSGSKGRSLNVIASYRFCTIPVVVILS